MSTLDTQVGHKANGFFGRIIENIARYRVYRTTLDELTNLSERELRDLGISRSEVRGIAYRAAFGG
ncbi:MAG: DUF1127 domain-containing protein [Pseudomonadota bacterium]